MKIVYTSLALAAVLVGFFGWQQINSIITSYSDKRTASIEHRLVCETLISIDDFNVACPSSAGKKLRVVSKSILFPNLSLCSISVTGEPQMSLHIAVDAFPGEEQSIDRFEHRKRNALVKEENVLRKMNDNTVLDGSASSRSLLIQKDHVYAEISPSGGGLCPKDELYALGGVLEERMLLFLPHRRSKTQ